LFFHQVHANRVSEFFAADVVVSAAVVLVFLIYELGCVGYGGLPFSLC
jgi:hypothetical protein